MVLKNTKSPGCRSVRSKADMLDQAINCTEFFRNESCGKCVPCRVGCQKLVEIGHDVRDGRYETDGLGAVESMIGDLRQAMEMASICGLGMVGANPLGSVAQHFPRDLATYLTTTRVDVRTDGSLPR